VSEGFNTVIADKGALPDNTIDSLFVNSKVQDRYSNMYYYEYDDPEFEDILIHIFSIPVDKKYTINSNETFLQYILDTFNNSDKFKDSQTQIVDSSINGQTIEVLLYRKNKYQGKHVRFIVNNEWTITSIKVLGSVPEDQIALFPVFASDPTNSDSLLITNKFDDSVYTFLNRSDYLIDNIPTSGIVALDNDQKNKLLSTSRLFSKDFEQPEQTNLVQESVTPGMSEQSMLLQYKNKNNVHTM
jgi:hypothetical protein